MVCGLSRLKVKFLLPGKPFRTQDHDSMFLALPDLADLEACLWLWEVRCSSFFSLSIFASAQILMSGKRPYKGTCEGEEGSSLRGVAFWLLYKTLPQPRGSPSLWHSRCGRERYRPCVYALGILRQWKPQLLLASDVMQEGLAGLKQTLRCLSVQMWSLDTGGLRFCYHCRVWTCGHSQFLLESSSLGV